MNKATGLLVAIVIGVVGFHLASALGVADLFEKLDTAAFWVSIGTMVCGRLSKRNRG